jgi:hypothetical protein
MKRQLVACGGPAVAIYTQGAIPRRAREQTVPSWQPDSAQAGAIPRRAPRPFQARSASKPFPLSTTPNGY